MDALQQDLFTPYKPEGRTVLVVETNIAEFGNRTDVIVVDDGNVRELSLLESSNESAMYFNQQSASPSSESIKPGDPGKDLGPLDDGKPKT